MRFASCLLVAALVGVGATGCLQDFSPDPLKSDVPPRDAGSRDGGRDSAADRDGDEAAPDSDASSSMSPSVPREDPGAIESDAGPAPNDCNVAGRYALIERFRTDALGAKQDGYNWFYVELAQSGSELRFASSVLCATRAVGLPPIPAMIDDLATRKAYLSKSFYADRRGTVEKTADGCSLSFATDAWVRGATPEYYRDVSIPLPTLDQPAQDGKPGWEDWEPDGHPGVTLDLSGAVSGQIYIAARVQTSYAGTVPDGQTSSMRLALTYSQTRSTLGYTGSPLLGSGDATIDPDPAYTYASFIRLSDADASEDAAARCQHILDANPNPP